MLARLPSHMKPNETPTETLFVSSPDLLLRLRALAPSPPPTSPRQIPPSPLPNRRANHALPAPLAHRSPFLAASARRLAKFSNGRPSPRAWRRGYVFPLPRQTTFPARTWLGKAWRRHLFSDGSNTGGGRATAAHLPTGPWWPGCGVSSANSSSPHENHPSNPCFNVWHFGASSGLCF
ncbi:hypothetical protein PVAP13_5NG164700 [Panicum virgatum]|uniref:Uncharacterized protein n=1 Tax=Panicum virgatum TaxID=38727 RepID=A0A8T0RN39_PANVG|nr:hypothetical protein PVAP13_5NG164700 [Panicum virgatum]